MRYRHGHVQMGPGAGKCGQTRQVDGLGQFEFPERCVGGDYDQVIVADDGRAGQGDAEVVFPLDFAGVRLPGA